MEKWIIGTGFSRGIGLALAMKFHQDGYKLFHLGRKKIGFESEFLWWDLLNPISDNPVKDLHKLLFGKNIHGFIYCAGLVPMLELKEGDRTQNRLFWQSQAEAMHVNYLACAELIEEILPFLFSPYDHPTESVLPFLAHLSSLAAIDPQPGLELFGATKAAAFHYFKWLAKRFKSEQLTCLSIHPGVVKTDMVLDILQKENPDNPIVISFNKLIEENKILHPAEVAAKIFDFIFFQKELKINSHGKLFLADKFHTL